MDIGIALIILSVSMLLGTSIISYSIFKRTPITIVQPEHPDVKSNPDAELVDRTPLDELLELDDLETLFHAPDISFEDFTTLMGNITDQELTIVPGEINENVYRAGILRLTEIIRNLANPSFKYDTISLADQLVDLLSNTLLLAVCSGTPLDDLWENYIQYWENYLAEGNDPRTFEKNDAYILALTKILQAYTPESDLH